MPEIDAREVIERFVHCLTTMSSCRAGWDYYDMPKDQRARENREEKEALGVARAIWQENPGLRDQLRAAFTETRPLATMSEIENG